MSQFPAICSARAASISGRHLILGAEPGLIGLRMLVIGAALAFLTAIAAVLQRPTPVAIPFDASAPLILRGDTPAALRDQAEALRASLLAQPGVGAVVLSGLHQQRLAVEYNAAHLAALGITPVELAAGLPVDTAGSSAGHLALRADSTLDSPQDVVSLPVRAGARVFRLGDVALVSRTPLDPPVSVLSVDGQPAVRVRVIPTR